jgi:hypothetical protein
MLNMLVKYANMFILIVGIWLLKFLHLIIFKKTKVTKFNNLIGPKVS